MRKFSQIMAMGALGAAVALAGCGGSGGGSPSTGRVDVLLTDAPLLNVNGKNFSELNVDITAFEASAPGSRSFTAVGFTNVGATVTSVNLLDLNNDQEWLAVASLTPGRYDDFRLSVDPATAKLIEDGTNQSYALTLANPSGKLNFRLTPPLEVTASGTHLLVVDWRADRSVRYDTQQQKYILSGDFHAYAVNRTTTPIPFRALPAKLTSVNTSSGELRVRVERHSAANYLARTTSATAFVDEQGNALTIADFRAGDFVILTGTVDGNTDIDASRVRRLPSPQHQPPGHHPGNSGGTPGTGGGHNQPPPGIVGAGGIIHQLGATSFVLDTAYRGPVNVTFDTTAGGTQFIDATVRPPQPSNSNILGNGFRVEVAGMYVAPTTAGGLPTIDATHRNGPGPNGGPGAIVLLRR